MSNILAVIKVQDLTYIEMLVSGCKAPSLICHQRRSEAKTMINNIPIYPLLEDALLFII